MKLKITADDILDEMGLCIGETIHPTDMQVERLVQLVADKSVQALTEDELEIFIDGEESDQMEIALRSLALSALHSLLNEIFNDA